MKGLETLSPAASIHHNGISRMPENLQGNPQDEQRTHNLHAEKKNGNGVEQNIESEQRGEDQITVPAPMPRPTLTPSKRDFATAVRAVTRKLGPGLITASICTRPIEIRVESSDITNGIPEHAHGFSHSESERVGDDGVAD